MLYLVDFVLVAVMLRARKIDCKRYQHIPFYVEIPRGRINNTINRLEKNVRQVWSYSLSPLCTRPHGAKGSL